MEFVLVRGFFFSFFSRDATFRPHAKNCQVVSKLIISIMVLQKTADLERDFQEYMLLTFVLFGFDAEINA